MSYAKKIALAIVALLIPFSVVASANAANETVSASTDLTPRSGSFFKEASVASNLRLDVEVTPGPGQTFVEPMKRVSTTFPAGMTFRANNNICPDSKLSLSSDLNSPSTIVNSCPNAVVGTGTAVILLARSVNGVIPDPILVAFNAGKTPQGQAKLKIYGYSKQTQVGILMTGTLRGRVLDIAIPVLSYDSAVKNFNLNFPGPVLDRQEELGFKTQGKDPNYVQARCAASPFTTSAVFELGQRNPATGDPVGDTFTVDSPTVTQDCTGKAGNAKLGAKVKGPKAVKNGAKGAFKVTIKNSGTATAKNVVVTAPGGKAKGGNIAPGKSKTVTVKATVRGKKGRKATVKFTVKSGKVVARTSAKVTVK